MAAGSKNLVANLPLGNVVGDFADDAGKFASGREGKGRQGLVLPLNHQHIGEIQCAGANIHSYMPGLKLG